MTVIRCIDFETTGFPPKAGVCEIGWTDLIVDGGATRLTETRAFLCNPGMPIGSEAAKVHGINDSDVADAPAAAQMFIKAGQGADVFCAHNAEFEQAFFAPPGAFWICTYKVALAHYADLPNHRNGTIPKHLGIDLDQDRSAPLHRAGPDTYVTARILQRFISDGLTISDMIEISRRPKSVTRMPFGKHAGAEIAKLPTEYLQWAADKLSAADVRHACADELRRRRS